jgi:Domain of unknown function (DUF4386)
MTDKWSRVTGAFGLGWFVLFVVGGIVLQGEPPPFDQPVAEAREFFADGGERYLVGDYIAGLGFILCFLPFVVGLRGLLGRAEGGLQIGSRLLLVAGVTTVVIGDGATVFTDTMALSSGAAELDDSTIRALLDANAVAIAAIGLPMALFAFAASAVVWATGVLPRWLAGIGLIAGVLHVAGAAFVIEGEPDGVLFTLRFMGLIAFGLFVLLTSINMLATGKPQATAPLATAAGERLGP